MTVIARRTIRPQVVIAAAISALALGLGGCHPPLPQKQITLDELLIEYNSNARSIPALAAYAEIQLTGYHAATGLGLPLWSSPNGLLRFKKGPEALAPHDMVLIGRELSHQIFRVGISRRDGVYYMWTRIPETQAMWGRTRLAGAPGIKLLPIDPTGLQAVLGICSLPDDLTKVPVVTMKMDTRPGHHAYVLSYIDRQPISNRMGLRREFRFGWDEERTKLLSEFLWGPQRQRRLEEVNFFDSLGRCVMTARVADYKGVDVSGLDNPPATQPIMPTDIRITWFDDRGRKTARVHLELSQLTAEQIFDDEIFQFRSNLPSDIPAGKVVQVDRDLEAPKKGGEK